jgi:hypothetical protein
MTSAIPLPVGPYTFELFIGAKAAIERAVRQRCTVVAYRHRTLRGIPALTSCALQQKRRFQELVPAYCAEAPFRC